VPLSHLFPQMAVVVGGAIIVVVSLVLPHRRQWVGAALAVASLAVAAVLQFDLLDTAPMLTFDGLWALDGLTGWTSVLVFGASAVAAVLAPQWLRTDPRHGEYYALLLFGALGASIMAAATDLNELVVGVLLSSVTGYVLAAYHRASPASVEAGMKFFLIGALTNALLLVGVTLLYGIGGTTLYGPLAQRLPDADPVALVAATALVVLGLTFEIGAVPAHAWLPDVAEGAPAPAAAFLTVVPKLGAVAALARLVTVLPVEAVGWRPLVAVVAAVTMTVGNLSALWQDDVRRLLGWSSVAQAGYALMAVVAIGRSALAIPALVFFLGAYAVANLAAFGVVVQLRGRTALADYAGLSAHRPWLAAGMVAALLSLVGIPPLAGFVGKLALFTVTLDAGYAWLAVLGVVNTVVSLFYYLRVAGPMYFGARERRPAVLGWSAGAGVAVAVVATGVAGVIGGGLLSRFATVTLVP
jgi:NADH-quinone oxidoreductase subunit N